MRFRQRSYLIFAGLICALSFAGNLRAQITPASDQRVLVRIYKNWRAEPASFVGVFASFDGFSIHLDPAELGSSAVVVLAASDQESPIREKLGPNVISWLLDPASRVSRISLPNFIPVTDAPYERTFTDADDRPLDGATVRTFINANGNFDFPGIEIDSYLLGESGAISSPQFLGDLRVVTYEVGPPGGTTAVIHEWEHRSQSARYRTALTQNYGSQENPAIIAGRVTDPEGNPIPRALVHLYPPEVLRPVIITPGVPPPRPLPRTIGMGHFDWTWDEPTFFRPHYHWVRTDADGRFQANPAYPESAGLPPPLRFYVHGHPELYPEFGDPSLIKLVAKMHVRAPKHSKLLDYWGKIDPAEGANIQLEAGGAFHTFRAVDSQGRDLDRSRLRNARMVVYRGGSTSVYPLGSAAVQNGAYAPPGQYHLTLTGAKPPMFRSVEVTDESLTEIVFEPVPSRTYAGQILDGLTGAPASDAVVLAYRTFRESGLSIESITDEQWDALSQTGEFEPNAAAVLDHFFIHGGYGRTDAEGRYTLSLEPGGAPITGVLVLRRGSFPTVISPNGRANNTMLIEFPPVPVFPAAKIRVTVNAEGISEGGAHVHWEADKKLRVPPWLDYFEELQMHVSCEIISNTVITFGRSSEFLVPAGVGLSVQFARSKYATHPEFGLPGKLRLVPGEVRDFGEIQWPEPVVIGVRVTDQDGNPASEIPVYFQSQTELQKPQITDASGLAFFTVGPRTRGEFFIMEQKPGPNGIRRMKRGSAKFDLTAAQSAEPAAMSIALASDVIEAVRAAGVDQELFGNGDPR